ncbi:MAG: metallophosphoesterase [Candidatus Staskawiczbacteria bacterium]|nr:metallophosphoesterase [Candidatus Staskawiczbacteria bacterium]
MKIAIISDTHDNVANFKKAVDWAGKNNISLILHAGDIGSPESMKESLADFSGQFFGVLGNMDIDYKILIEEYNKISGVKVNEDVLETQIEDKKIAITHYPEKARDLAESGAYDMVINGHTHKPWEEKIGLCKIINPGELAGQMYKPTFAVYDTDKDNLELKILEKI